MDWEKHPLTLEEAEKIPDVHERNFAIATTSKRLNVTYEPCLFSTEIDGKQRGTLPDFYIENPRNPVSGGTFIEVGAKSSWKKHQRQVMRSLGATVIKFDGTHLLVQNSSEASPSRYIQFVGEVLDRIR